MTAAKWLYRAEKARADAAEVEVAALTDANDRLGAMVEWLCEVIVDARDACQRAERIEPKGSPDWVESGIAMRTTALREVRAILDRERNAHPSRLDEALARADAAEAAVARVRALHAPFTDTMGTWCSECLDADATGYYARVAYPCATIRALDSA